MRLFNLEFVLSGSIFVKSVFWTAIVLFLWQFNVDFEVKEFELNLTHSKAHSCHSDMK